MCLAKFSEFPWGFIVSLIEQNVCEYVCFTGKQELTSADPNLITIYTERKSYN